MSLAITWTARPDRKAAHTVIASLFLSDLVYAVVRRSAAAMGLVTRRELDDRLEKIAMTAAAREDELNLRLATRLGMLMAEVASLRASVTTKDAALAAAQAELVSQVAGRDSEIARQVGEALELDAQRDAARIEELLRQAGEEVPAPVPDVPIPAPGEPAVPPDGSDVTPVDEDSLPDTPTS